MDYYHVHGDERKKITVDISRDFFDFYEKELFIKGEVRKSRTHDFEICPERFSKKNSFFFKKFRSMERKVIIQSDKETALVDFDFITSYVDHKESLYLDRVYFSKDDLLLTNETILKIEKSKDSFIFTSLGEEIKEEDAIKVLNKLSHFGFGEDSEYPNIDHQEQDGICVFLNSLTDDPIIYSIRERLDHYVNSRNTLFSLLKVLVFYRDEFDSILSSNEVMATNILTQNHKNISFNKEGNKLKQKLGVPNKVMDFMKEKDLTDKIFKFQEIAECSDGNDVVILTDFLSTADKHLRSLRVGIPNIHSLIDRFIDDFASLLNYQPEYRIKPVLEYLIRQRFYKRAVFKEEKMKMFPDNELRLLRDTYRIADSAGFNLNLIEKYPSDLEVYHNILMQHKNIEVDKEALNKSLSFYKDMEKSYKNYSFIVPSSLNEIIDEGNALNHCVASYANAVVKGTSKIVFMRETKSPDKSFLTIELDRENNLSHAKKKGNEDPEKNEVQIIKNWLKEMKREE